MADVTSGRCNGDSNPSALHSLPPSLPGSTVPRRCGMGKGRYEALPHLHCPLLCNPGTKGRSPIEDEGYSLAPMLRFINSLSHEKLTDEEIEPIDEDIRSSSRSKITCRELKKSETLKALCVQEDCRCSDGSNDGDPAAKRAADIIMGRGNVLKFLVRQAQRNHIGDEDVLRHLLASIASTNSLKSAGIQPELNGPKGHGKTDAVKAVFHLILINGNWQPQLVQRVFITIRDSCQAP